MDIPAHLFTPPELGRSIDGIRFSVGEMAPEGGDAFGAAFPRMMMCKGTPSARDMRALRSLALLLATRGPFDDGRGASRG